MKKTSVSRDVCQMGGTQEQKIAQNILDKVKFLIDEVLIINQNFLQ